MDRLWAGPTAGPGHLPLSWETLHPRGDVVRGKNTERGNKEGPGVEENVVVWSSHGEREASGGHGSQGKTGTIRRGGVSAATAQHAAHGEGRVCGTDSQVSQRPPQEMSLLVEEDGQRLAEKDKGGRDDEQQRQREKVNETDVRFQVGFFLWCFPFLSF